MLQPVELAPEPSSARAVAKHIASLRTPQVGHPPVTLDDSRVARVLTSLRKGAYLIESAGAAGINRDAIYRTLERAKQGDPDAVAFQEAVDQARDEGEEWHAANITRHAEKEWTASAWMLERTRPDRYGRRTVDDPGARVSIMIGQVSDGTVSVTIGQSAVPALNTGDADASSAASPIDVTPIDAVG